VGVDDYRNSAGEAHCSGVHIFQWRTYCGPGSSVGIATDYGLDGPGGAKFSARPERPCGPPSLL